MRKSIPSTLASAPSNSCDVDARVHVLTVNRLPRCAVSAIRPASAPGTCLGYPALVNPLMPTAAAGISPASFADIPLPANALGLPIRFHAERLG